MPQVEKNTEKECAILEVYRRMYKRGIFEMKRAKPTHVLLKKKNLSH